MFKTTTLRANLDRFSVLAVYAAFAIALLAFAILFETFRDLRIAADWVIHTQRLQTELTTLHSNLIRAEIAIDALGGATFLLLAVALLALRQDRRLRLEAETRLVALNANLESALQRRSAELESARAHRIAIFDAMSEGMHALNADWRYTFVSKRAGQLLERDPATMLGRRVWDLYPHLEHGEFRAACERVRTTSLAQEGELLLEEHAHVWYAYQIAPLDDGVAVYFRNVTRRKRQTIELAEYAARMEKLSRRLISVGEEQRRALARELHDDFGQNLAALKLDLGFLAQSGEAAMRARALGGIAVADRLIAGLRDRTLELRPPLLDDHGLAAAVTEYSARQSERSAVTIDYDPRPAERLAPPAEVALVAFRLVQESIHNALRYAACSRIEVRIEPEDGYLRVEVRDNGIGLRALAAADGAPGSSGMGIDGMRERVALIGGRFAIDSLAGAGVAVRAALPLAG